VSVRTTRQLDRDHDRPAYRSGALDQSIVFRQLGSLGELHEPLICDIPRAIDLPAMERREHGTFKGVVQGAAELDGAADQGADEFRHSLLVVRAATQCQYPSSIDEPASLLVLHVPPGDVGIVERPDDGVVLMEDELP